MAGIAQSNHSLGRDAVYQRNTFEFSGYGPCQDRGLVGAIRRMTTQILLVMLCFTTDPNLVIAICPPGIIKDEIQMLDDPNMLAQLFTEWDRERTGPYLTVTIENWLRADRARHYPKVFNGVKYSLWLAPYSWASDLNHDEKINMKDFGIVAKYYRGGLSAWAAPAPGGIMGEVPIEILAEMLRDVR